MHAVSPLPARDRDDRIDALRGFAIAGVLLMNLPMFMRTPLSAGWVESMVPGWGNLGPALYAWLGQGKFVAILAGLYGVGIARRGFEAASTSARRLGFLAALGVAQALAWPGDILVGWALTGALLLVTRRVPPWIVVTVGLLLPAALAGAGYLDLIAPARRAAIVSQVRMGPHVVGIAWLYLPMSVPVLVAQATLGAWLGRQRWHGLPSAPLTPGGPRPFSRYLRALLAIVGLVLSAVPPLPLLTPRRCRAGAWPCQATSARPAWERRMRRCSCARRCAGSRPSARRRCRTTCSTA